MVPSCEFILPFLLDFRRLAMFGKGHLDTDEAGCQVVPNHFGHEFVRIECSMLSVPLRFDCIDSVIAVSDLR